MKNRVKTFIGPIGLFLLVAWLATGCAPVVGPTSSGDQSAAVMQEQPQAASEVAPVAVDEPAAATPVCTGQLTSSNQEGPYFTPGSPERANLIDDGMPGTALLISGYVWSQECAPLAGAKVDFWQADANGVYDNLGYTLRGHVFTDETGYYEIVTIEPGPYPGRPPHIHVKVIDATERELLTTQLYTDGSQQSADVRNAPDLLAAYAGLDAAGRQRLAFDFVVRANP